MNDVVFYNMWGRERYQDYINLPFKYKEEHEWVTDLQKNNAYFLDHINEYASGAAKSGLCTDWISGLVCKKTGR